MTLRAIVVASAAENIDLATEHGFDALWWSNEYMGSKWNAGFAYAADRGADLFVLIGSDNWIHPTAFAPPPDGMISAARAIDFVDLERGVVQHATHDGLIPWLIPRALLEPVGFLPFPDRMQRGTEAMLRGALGLPQFELRDGPPGVDFKSAESASPYAGVRNSIGDGVEHPLETLEQHYPAPLVEVARRLSKEPA